MQRNPLTPQHDVPLSLLTHKGGFLYTPSHLKQVLSPIDRRHVQQREQNGQKCNDESYKKEGVHGE